MVSSERAVLTALALLLALVLAPATFAVHDHAGDGPAASHTDCAACHLRHVSAVATAGTLALPAPDRVAAAITPATSDAEQPAARGSNPSRAPPA